MIQKTMADRDSSSRLLIRLMRADKKVLTTMPARIRVSLRMRPDSRERTSTAAMAAQGPHQRPQGEGAQAQKGAAHAQHDQQGHPEGRAGGHPQGEGVGQGIEQQPLEDHPHGGQGRPHQAGEHHPG